MNFKRVRRTEFDIPKLPLVALIDVVFFLLLYFIMAGNLAAVEANLESSLKTDKRSAGSASNLVPQIVNIEGGPGGQGLFRLGERAMSDKKSLTETLRSLTKEGGVVVRVSGSAPAHAVAAALQACRDAGFTKISYVPRSGEVEAGGGAP